MHNQQPPRKNILIVGLYPPPFSSGETVITQYFHDLLSQTYEVTGINMSIGVLAPAKFKFESLIYYSRTIINFFIVFWKVFYLSRKHNYSLCYLTPASSKPGHIRDIIILKLLSKNVKKVAINIQNGNYQVVFQRNWHKSLTKNFSRRITLAIFTSQILRKKAEIYFGPEKCVIIRNSVDDKIKCTIEEVQKATNNKLQRTQFVISYISNMNPTKGYMDLLEALFGMSSEDREGLVVNLIGEWLSDEQLSEVKNMIKLNSLDDNITIHGKVNDRMKLRDFYLESNVFILPTYFPREAQPVSIIEALNAGVPVIATNHASIPDLITDNFNGLLVGIKSPSEIKKAILRLKTDRKFWLQTSNNARQSFENSFTSEKIRESILSLVESEINK